MAILELNSNFQHRLSAIYKQDISILLGYIKHFICQWIIQASRSAIPVWLQERKCTWLQSLNVVSQNVVPQLGILSFKEVSFEKLVLHNMN